MLLLEEAGSSHGMFPGLCHLLFCQQTGTSQRWNRQGEKCGLKLSIPQSRLLQTQIRSFMQLTTEPQKYLCWPAERSKQPARAEEGWTCILSMMCRAQNCWSRLTSPCSPTATTPLCWMGQVEAFCRTKLKRTVRCLHQAFCSAEERVV